MRLGRGQTRLGTGRDVVVVVVHQDGDSLAQNEGQPNHDIAPSADQVFFSDVGQGNLEETRWKTSCL